MTLTDADRALLDFADQRWKARGNHADAIRAEFGITVTRFWQKVNNLLDREDALDYAPLTVNRLRRLRGDVTAR